MHNFLKECMNNANIEINNTSQEDVQILLEISYYICESYDTDIDLAKYHLEIGVFKQCASRNITRHRLLLVNILQNMY